MLTPLLIGLLPPTELQLSHDRYAPMTVTPFRVPLLQDPKALYECLASFQPSTAKDDVFISVSLALPAVDPLQVLEEWGGATQPHFYWEHPTEGLAIAALQPLTALVLQDTAQKGDRFTQAQQFISETLQRTATLGDLHLPFAGPHFFCSFTFFEQPYHEAQRFSSATVFLPKWQVVRWQRQGILVANLPLNSATDLAETTDTLWHTWQRLQSRGGASPPSWLLPRLPLPVPLFSHQNRFLKAAEATLAAIQSGEIEKLVLSEILEVTPPTPLPLISTLHRLRSRYGDCQVFSLRTEQGHGFMGASPERLLQLQNRQLTVDALAGSAPRGLTRREDRVLGDRLLHSTKDIHEHQVVLSFIQQRLQGLGLTPQVQAPAHLLQLPNIQHLRTLVTAELPPHLHLLNLLAALHPTPAVAGTPQQFAEPYLHRFESCDRHLYAAPLGWVDHRGNGSFTVGIRSALLQDNAIRLYAGAGIVAGSDPHREWAEVRLKLQTLLQALVEYPLH